MGIHQKKIIETIQQTGLSLYRKYHPREKERVTDEYTIQLEYPWELYVLQHPLTKVVKYSLFSSVLTSSFVLSDSYEIKNYYLYPIVVKELNRCGYKDSLDNDLLTFFDRLVKVGKVIPIYSLAELERICKNEVIGYEYLLLIHHVGIFSKSMIVSIGMNALESIKGTLPILEK